MAQTGRLYDALARATEAQVNHPSASSSDMGSRMPCMRQKGPTCGTTCLSMCLEYHGFPAAFELIEPYLHPYGVLDLGEVPAELARYARMLGFSARHYNHGSLEVLADHIEQGHTVTVMVNYSGGTGHILNVIAVDRGEQGRVKALRLRNPWGYDERITAERFQCEWRRMRQSRSGIGGLLPVFDRGYLVVAPPDEDLPALSLRNWLHSAPVNALVAGMNGIGASIKTIRDGHRLFGGLQCAGNVLRTLGGLLAYIVGNLIGKNLEFASAELAESLAASSQATVAWRRCLDRVARGCLSCCGAVGWLLSLHGGLMALLIEALAAPLLLGAEACNRRHAIREHVASARDDHLKRVLAHSSAGAKANQLRALLRSFGVASAADRAAAVRLVKLCPLREPNQELDALIDRLLREEQEGESVASGAPQHNRM